MPHLTESDLEMAALAWLESVGWTVKHAGEIAPGEPFAERKDYREVVLAQRLRDALARLNPDLPQEALEEAFRKIINPAGAMLEARNRSFHRMLVDGVTVEYRRRDHSIAGVQARVIDFDDPENNSWLAVNQFTVSEKVSERGFPQLRRPDVVLFVNGFPLAIIELKNPADQEATILRAYQQLQTYKSDLPTLFTFNELLVISDGEEALLGTLTAGREWFKRWRTISGEGIEDVGRPQLEVLIKGVFEKRRLLDLLRDFIVFEDDGSRLDKKVAGYHQFHAVRVAVEETLRAAAPKPDMIAEEKGLYEAGRRPGGQPGDRRVGVIWHTQGSGKSLTMAFYAGRIIREPAMENPTLVVLTDRNDLDAQLYGTFSRCQDLLRQPPVQAESRAHLRQLLSVQAGGVVFTTIQKFFPDVGVDAEVDVGAGPGACPPSERPWAISHVLSDRRNIVVIADEAHRSQYDFIDGFARHMRDALPNASFIAFTGTPLELEDRNTRLVFGDYISIYDIQRAVEDQATVPIYYESRLAELELDEHERPRIDPDFEEVTEGEEIERKEKLKTKWAHLEAVVGAQKRLKLIAKDIVEHFERRLEALDGKAMVVCMSRRICVELYREITSLRPDWHNDDDDKGEIKIVMTGSASDPPDWQPHIRNKQRRELLARRFRNPNDPFKMVIVRDMWLTGFDCPSLQTMYIDKPMRGHTLMQAIARVNRVFRDKPGGLVVDYLGLAHELKQALATYTESGGRGSTALDQAEAVSIMLEKYEICTNLFHGFDWSSWKTGRPEERVSLLAAAQEHILAQEDGKERLIREVRDLSKAFALSVPHEAALRISDDVAFLQSVRVALVKRAPGEARPEEELDHAIRQIVSRAIVPEGVVDLFQAAGLKKPDISILSDEFLAEVRGMEHKNLAVDLLRKLLNGEIRTRRRKNIIQARSFAEMLEQTLSRYQKRALEAAQAIERLIQLAMDMREADRRAQEFGLTDEELAIYDALEAAGGTARELGEQRMKTIAREISEEMSQNVTVDWVARENVRAGLKVTVKRILRKHGYPQDKIDEASQLILEQAEAVVGVGV
ncbi:MAG: type I restriction endonuclease subunit R [bacterium]